MKDHWDLQRREHLIKGESHMKKVLSVLVLVGLIASASAGMATETKKAESHKAESKKAESAPAKK